MTNNYIATAYASNLIKFSAVGHFVHPAKQHLLTVKSHTLELHAIEHDELVEFKQVRVPQNLLGMWSFRPKAHSKDFIVMLTRQLELFVIELEMDLMKKVKIVTKFTGKYPSSGDLTRLDGGPLAIIHPENRFICLAIYSQRLEIIDLSDLKHVKSFPIRCPGPDGVKIIAMEFLSENTANDCTMACLQSTSRGNILTISNLNVRTKEKEKPLVTFTKLDFEASYLLVVPEMKLVPAGVLVVGNGIMQYYNPAKQYALTEAKVLTNMTITASCVLFRDLDRGVITYLLGGADGRLVLLVVRTANMVEGTAGGSLKTPYLLNVEFIGVASAAQTLSVVGPGLVYLGTCSGPGSILLKLRDSDRNPETKFYYDVIQSFPALGSILQLQDVKKNDKDQSSLLACTADTFGNSLTIVRNGINLQDPVEIAVAGIQMAWHMETRERGRDRKEIFLLTDFTSTRYCVLEGDDLCEMEEAGDLDLTQRTLLFRNVTDTVCVQVTPEKIILLSRADHKSLAGWERADSQISAARMVQGTLAVACGSDVCLLDILDAGILDKGNIAFPHEICSLELFSDQSDNLFLAVGEWITWDVSLVEVSSVAMTVIQTLPHTSDIQPRSLMFCRFSDDMAYLFCGRGDGNVDYFHFNESTKELEGMKHFPLGTRLVTFTRFHAQSQVNVFACSDRPSVISCRGGKLLFSNVNITDAVAVGSMGDGSDDLMVITGTSLLMGRLEDIQKIHFIPLPLGFQVFRLAVQPDGGSTIAVIGDRKDCRSNKFSILPSIDACNERILHVLDRHSFQIIASHQAPEPSACFTCLCYWTPQGKSFLIVGTDNDPILTEQERNGSVGHEKKHDGSILVLELINDRLQKITSYHTSKEPIRDVMAHGDLLLATTDSGLLSFEWLGHQLDEPNILDTPGSLNCHLDSVGNTVLVGDFQKSLILADLNPNTRVFDVSARDLTQYGFLSLMLRDRETVMGGDDQGNLLVLRVSKEKTDTSDVRAIDPISWIGVGDPITTIKRGSLVSPESTGDVSVVVLDSFVYGTCRGQLGVIFELEDHLFNLLKHIEKHLLATTKLLGTWDPARCLRFSSRLMESPHSGFVDGDLVETALSLRRTELESILTKIYAAAEAMDLVDDDVKMKDRQYGDVDVVLKLIDDLTRLH